MALLRVFTSLNAHTHRHYQFHYHSPSKTLQPYATSLSSFRKIKTLHCSSSSSSPSMDSPPEGYRKNVGICLINSDKKIFTASRLDIPDAWQMPQIMSNQQDVFDLRSTLKKDKLNANNFFDWERNLRIVLRWEGKESVLDSPLPTELPATARQSERVARQAIIDNALSVTRLMLSCMESDFQIRFNGMDAYSIIQQLKAMFQPHARLERLELNRKILRCELTKGQAVGPHVFKMIGYFQQMEKLGFSYPLELSIDIIMGSLHNGFNTFRTYFYMHGGKASLQELHGMLVHAERSILKDPQKLLKDVKAVKTTSFKKKGLFKALKGKGKEVAIQSSERKQIPEQAKEPKVIAEHKCFYCKNVGHWKRNCLKFIEDKKNGASTLGTKK